MAIRGLSGNLDQLGAIERAGDVDGDGIDDVLLPGPFGRRVASVLRGGPRRSLVRARQPSRRILPIDGTRGWGNLAIGIGDHGGDRRDDLAIATEQRGRRVEMGVWFAFGHRGARRYRLSAGRHVRTVRAGRRHAGTYVAACGRPAARVGRCPADPDSVASDFSLQAPLPLGDVDGDGFDDVLVQRLGVRRRGVSSLLFGGRTTRRHRRVRTLPIQAYEALGDVDGDGVPDILAARRGEVRGRIMHLTRSGRVAATSRIRRDGVYGAERIGDTDADGFADVLAFDDRGALVVYGAPGYADVDARHDTGRAVRVRGAF
jgi:hypothetical protein